MTLLQKVFQKMQGQHCLACMQYHENGQLLCHSCLLSLPWLETFCHKCALPLSMETSYCGQCMAFLPDYVQVKALFVYQAPISKMIHDLKYHHTLYWAAFFGNLMAQRLKGTRPQLIIPMPTAKEALKKRGFNPAMEIARALSKALDIPILGKPFEVLSKQGSQSQLNKVARLKNVAHIFKVQGPLPIEDVVIVDDVMTTGATLTAFSKALHQQGVRNIQAFLVARTPKDK